jgi:pimeloyl-ACP methyl ester carboxylesterase
MRLTPSSFSRTKRWRGVDEIRKNKIPCRALHGALDEVVPLQQTLQLQERWPEMQLKIIKEADHKIPDTELKSL